MEALSSLSAKIVARNGCQRQSPARSNLLGRSDVGFLRCPNFKNPHFYHLFLFGGTDDRSLIKPHVVSDEQDLTWIENPVSGLQRIKASKTAHVKFQLQKKCMFGEQFLLVGDHVLIGLWDPSNAIAMKWSDGDMWSVEMDVPIDLTLQFKFVLKGNTGELFWQPGPDRIFKTWESKSTIVVAEDWETSGAQKIMEEQVTDGIKERILNPDFEPVVDGHVSLERDEVMLNLKLPYFIADSEDEPNVSRPFAHKECMDNLVDGALRDANKEVGSEESLGWIKEASACRNNTGTLAGEMPVTEENEESSFSMAGGSVLVPGLTPLQEVSSEQALSKELGSVIADSSLGSCWRQGPENA